MKSQHPITKSPRAVAQEALTLAHESLPAYMPARSRKGFTAHQLFAILAPQDLPEGGLPRGRRVRGRLRRGSRGPGAAKVPNHSPLCYAERRLLKGGIRRPPVPRHRVRNRRA